MPKCRYVLPRSPVLRDFSLDFCVSLGGPRLLTNGQDLTARRSSRQHLLCSARLDPVPAPR